MRFSRAGRTRGNLPIQNKNFGFFFLDIWVHRPPASGTSDPHFQQIPSPTSPPAVITLSWVLGRPWVLASTSPCTCPKRDLIHENGSDRDALEGGRELGGFSKRQAVIADMAKWGSGEASGAPEFPLAIDQIGMGGVRTIELDDLRGLLRLVRRSVVAYLRDDRR